ncbi:GGDEF domain-containing phosphodiesterase [Alicyclobacillus sp. TC]|nr:GGDEF domain-containing phosphodiesterase [Alicyclobacillus sp. TC]
MLSISDFSILSRLTEDAFYICKLDPYKTPSVILDVNPSACCMLGYSREELIGKSTKEIVHPNLHSRLSSFFETLEEAVPKQYHSVHVCKGGKLLTVEVTAQLLTVQDEVYAFAICRDITPQIRSEQALYHLAYFDSRTNFPNQSWLQEKISSVFGRLQDERKLLFLAISFDNFYIVADAYGWKMANHVMEELMLQAQTCDTEIYLGQSERNEFLLVHPIQDEEEATNWAARLMKKLEKNNFSQTLLFRPRIIGGLYINSIVELDAFEKINSAIERSLTALHLARSSGKSQLCYHPQMVMDVLRRQHFYNLLRDAMDEKQFYLVYQPIFDINQKLVAAETLLRLNGPNGAISPAEFIPVVERTGMIHDLGEYVLQQAFQDFSSLYRQNLESPLILSINCSVHQLEHPKFYPYLLKLFSQHIIPPSQVKLELTETVMLNSAVHLEMIKKLKDLGVMIAIDDFGTGYASFTYLLDIRPDVIKIDQSFIRKLAQVDKPDRDNERIVASMLTLARQLGISTVAEGVETVPQLQWLQQHGAITQLKSYRKGIGSLKQKSYRRDRCADVHAESARVPEYDARALP